MPNADSVPATEPARAPNSLLSLGPADLAVAIALALGVGLCVASGTGFEGWGVARGYIAFFGHYVVYLFVLVRAVSIVRYRWRPRGSLGRRALGWVGGPAGPEEFFRADTEFLRCLVLLIVTLTVYTNLKARIPFVNETVGDDLYQAVDNVIFGERLMPWIEARVAADPALSRFLNRVYSHGYVWMVALTFWLWLRSDARRLRWLFVSFSLLYMSAVLVTALYPSFGPFFLDWQRFEWARDTQSGRVQAMLVSRFVRATELVEKGLPLRPGAFEGIAAFPSLHVGHMILISVVAWSTARLFAIFMFGVALVTTVATVAFGWHYLIDAVAGALLAVAIAFLVRPRQSRSLPVAPPTAPPAARLEARG